MVPRETFMAIKIMGIVWLVPTDMKLHLFNTGIDCSLSVRGCQGSSSILLCQSHLHLLVLKVFTQRMCLLTKEPAPDGIVMIQLIFLAFLVLDWGVAIWKYSFTINFRHSQLISNGLLFVCCIFYPSWAFFWISGDHILKKPVFVMSFFIAKGGLLRKYRWSAGKIEPCNCNLQLYPQSAWKPDCWTKLWQFAFNVWELLDAFEWLSIICFLRFCNFSSFFLKPKSQDSYQSLCHCSNKAQLEDNEWAKEI